MPRILRPPARRWGRRARPRRLRAAAGAAALLVVTAGAAVTPAAHAQMPPGQTIDRDAHADFDWTVPARYRRSLDAWHESSSRYDDTEITPHLWSVTLDACSSRSRRRIERYEFLVQRIGKPSFTRGFVRRSCKLRLRHVLPGLGRYRVTLTLRTARGRSARLPRIITLRDILIAVVGDSLNAGEGNPDRPTEYQIVRPGEAIPIRGPEWQSKRCHRSARTGPALEAEAIERASRKTSVTFVSFACSGATVPQLYDETYEGAVPDGHHDKLAPQLDALRVLVGRGSRRGERKIDALLVSGGVNDLGFSTIVRACATNDNFRPGHTDCVTGFAKSRLVSTPQFAARYDRLAASIARLDVRETYITRYPADVFIGGGCRITGFPGVGIDQEEGSAMSELGNHLNTVIENAGLRHRRAGWNLIDNMTGAFSDHHYCAADPWFVERGESFRDQGDELGTAHPNNTGHKVFAGFLRRAVVPNQAQRPLRRTTLVIDAIKLKATSSEAPQQVLLRQVRFGSDFRTPLRTVRVPATGNFEPISPTALGRFRTNVFRPPASPRHATEVRVILETTTQHTVLAVHHGFDENFGAGKQKKAHPNGEIAVRYHVRVRKPAGEPQIAPG